MFPRFSRGLEPCIKILPKAACNLGGSSPRNIGFIGFRCQARRSQTVINRLLQGVEVLVDASDRIIMIHDGFEDSPCDKILQSVSKK